MSTENNLKQWTLVQFAKTTKHGHLVSTIEAIGPELTEDTDVINIEDYNKLARELELLKIEMSSVYSEIIRLNSVKNQFKLLNNELRSKLKIAVEALKDIEAYGHSDLCKSMKTIRPNYRCYGEDAEEALSEIGDDYDRL